MRRIALGVILLLFTSCAPLVPIWTGFDQPCPAWVSLDTSSCDIYLQNYTLTNTTSSPSRVELNLATYDQIRLTIVGGNVVIESGDNFLATTDQGSFVSLSAERIYPGTYLIRKLEPVANAKLIIVNPGTTYVYISSEWAKIPQSKKI